MQGTYVRFPFWGKKGFLDNEYSPQRKAVTAHPLGGVPMGTSSTDGAVDMQGRQRGKICRPICFSPLRDLSTPFFGPSTRRTGLSSLTSAPKVLGPRRRAGVDVVTDRCAG